MAKRKDVPDYVAASAAEFAKRMTNAG